MLVVTGNINILNIYEYLSTRYPSTTILVLITSTTITFALIWFRCCSSTSTSTTSTITITASAVAGTITLTSRSAILRHWPCASDIAIQCLGAVAFVWIAVAHALSITSTFASAVVVARLVQIFKVFDHAVHDLYVNGQLAVSRIEPWGEKETASRFWSVDVLVHFKLARYTPRYSCVYLQRQYQSRNCNAKGGKVHRDSNRQVQRRYYCSISHRYLYRNF